MLSAEAHPTSRKDRPAQFGSPDWRLEAVPVTLTASPSLRSSGIKKLQFTRGKRDDGIWRGEGEVEDGRMGTEEREINKILLFLPFNSTQVLQRVSTFESSLFASLGLTTRAGRSGGRRARPLARPHPPHSTRPSLHALLLVRVYMMGTVA